MLAKWAADALVLLHLSFIVFVMLGGLLALRWPRTAWVHLPAVAWGAYVEFTGSVCPLTPIEQALRESAGAEPYAGGFIEHYIVPLIYPTQLTPQTGLVLGVVVLLVNGTIYAMVLWKRRRQDRWPFGSRMR